MQNELLVLLGRDINNHKRFRGFVKEYTLRKETKLLLDNIDLYYRNHPSETRVDWNSFESWFLTVRGTHLTPSEAKLYGVMLDRIRKLDDDGSVVMEEVLEHFVKLDYVGRVQDALTRILKDDTVDLAVVGKLISEYEDEVGKALVKSELFVSTDLRKILTSVSEPGFEWAQDFLNVSAGPLRKGDFVIFGARPEYGKTTWAASNVQSWLQQPIEPDRPILWINNEERSDKVMMRVYQAMFRATTEEIEADPDHFNSMFESRVKEGRFLLLANDGGVNHVNGVEALCVEYNPCLIIFDQLDKVHGFNSEKNDVLRLGALYKWARELAVKYGPVVALSQMSEAAELDKYPHYSKLRGSKTDKSGEGDLVIGMGLNDYDSDIRGFFISKNKLHGGPRTVSSLRHGKFDARIVPDRAYFEEPKGGA